MNKPSLWLGATWMKWGVDLPNATESRIRAGSRKLSRRSGHTLPLWGPQSSLPSAQASLLGPLFLAILCADDLGMARREPVCWPLIYFYDWL